jgi:hypothetical protein
MRRALLFLEWKSKWWSSQSARRNIESSLREGLEAYALDQANLQDQLAKDFRRIWKKPLADDQMSDNEDNEGVASEDDDSSEDEEVTILHPLEEDGDVDSD